MKPLYVCLLLLFPATASAQHLRPAHRPFPARIVTRIAHNASEAVRTCASTWQMRFECAAILGSAAYDFKATRDDLNISGLHESDFLFGRHPSSTRLVLEGGAMTFLQIEALAYVHREAKPNHLWEPLYVAPIATLHLWSAQHDEHLAAGAR